LHSIESSEELNSGAVGQEAPGQEAPATTTSNTLMGEGPAALSVDSGIRSFLQADTSL